MKTTLCLAGLMRSGKDFVAKYIVDNYNYKHLNMSDVIKDELIKEGKEPSKLNRSILGDEWRKLYGNDIVMKRTLEKAQDYDKVIITGVRSPEELEYLKQHTERFKLILVHASREVRFARRSTTDPQSFEAFFERDERDIKFKGTGQVIQKADYVVDNEGAIEAIYKQIEKIIQRIDYVRPSWDEYFMNLAMEVGKRGTCDRGRTGVLVVKDKNILATGYIGSPSGLEHCDEVGHQMKTVTHEDGRISKHCVRGTHGEQNAICQAAKNGISIDGATMYCKLEPCPTCAKMVINAGIKRVVANNRYHAAQETRDMFERAGIILEVLNDSELY
jgi:dCMP deaminase